MAARGQVSARSIMVTGGAGFIGSSLAIHFKHARPSDRVTALDNLRRRGSELNLPRLRDAGVEFVHGDVRNPGDLAPFDERVDVLVECSADPSVLAGHDGHTRYVVDSNLVGCVNCLELARRCGATFVFLSTSRVYPTAALRSLRYETREARFELLPEQPLPGASERGIAEEFPLQGARTLYGATKLASELLIAEYVDMFGLRAVVDRCGVVSGPWQMGRSEQGVFAHWMIAHALGRPLAYQGFGGRGHQVRDVLHVDDLAALVDLQIERAAELSGEVFNVGGGRANSASLAEFTRLCADLTGANLPIGSQPDTRAGDIPLYVSDNARVQQKFAWAPERSVERLARDLHAWTTAQRRLLETTLR